MNRQIVWHETIWAESDFPESVRFLAHVFSDDELALLRLTSLTVLPATPFARVGKSTLDS